MKNNAVKLSAYVNLQNSELATVEAVEKGIIHVIAASIATDTDVLTFLRKLYVNLKVLVWNILNLVCCRKEQTNFTIQTKKSGLKSTKQSAAAGKKHGKDASQSVDESKYADYFDFNVPVKYIKPHQVICVWKF